MAPGDVLFWSRSGDDGAADLLGAVPSNHKSHSDDTFIGPNEARSVVFEVGYDSIESAPRIRAEVHDFKTIEVLESTLAVSIPKLTAKPNRLCV